MNDLIEKAKNTHLLSRDELICLLKDSSVNEELFNAADKVRHEFAGDDVHLRALIEYTNICKCNCFYCGLRSANRNVDRYRLSPDEIIEFAKQAVSIGYKTIVLQGGEDDYFTSDILAGIIFSIKSLNTAITLSLGERSYDDYKILKDAGADRFLLRIETTDKALYEKLHPNMSFENRVRCLNDLKSLGFETGTGCLVGLPGQTVESLADDILFFKKLDADMIGLGPFIPHPQTPLKDVKNNPFILSLKVMALTRLLLPDINIPATTAMETINPNGRLIALQSGANVVMPNVTEGQYREKYEIYPGKVSVDYSQMSENLLKIGRTVSTKFGFRGGKK